uniref:CSON008973 protein n=1 Tax=Culicoides sonorensis TaxID=179676 RepID=A0A336M4W1_CULSO
MEINDHEAFEDAKHYYRDKMDEICRRQLDFSLLGTEHSRIKMEAIDRFRAKRKLAYNINLAIELENQFSFIKRTIEENDSKEYENHLDADSLQAEHLKIKNAAIEQFKAKQKILNSDLLDKELETIFINMKANIETNDSKEFVEDKHSKFKKGAIAQFNSKPKTDDSDKLDKVLEEIFTNQKTLIEAHDLKELDANKNYYKAEMKKACQQINTVEQLIIEHNKIKQTTLRKFDTARKMLDIDKLSSEVDRELDVFKTQIEKKQTGSCSIC